MKQKKVFEITPQLEEKIIASAYGEGNILNNIKVRRLIKKSSYAHELYQQHKTIAEKFDRLEFQKCPDEVIEVVEEQIQKNSIKTKFYEIIRPALTFTMLAAAMITAIITFSVDHQTSRKIFDSEEITAAKEQLHLSLSLIGKIMNKTESEITPKIINEKVGDPLIKGLPIINNSISGG